MRALGLVLLAGCGRIDFSPLADGGSACAWSTPVPLTELVVAGKTEYAPAITPDGATIYFTSEPPGLIESATRVDSTSPFGSAAPVSQLNIGSFETDATMTGDGLEVFFRAAMTAGSTDCLYRATRTTTSDVWGTAVAESALCNVGASGPAISDDGLTLYFHIVASSTNRGTLHVSTRATRADAFDIGVPLAPFQGGSAKGFADIAPSDLVLYYEADPGDVWQASRADKTSPFDAPVLLFPGFGDPYLSHDGRELFLVSASDQQLYVARRACSP
jgi:hypothetical protein